MTNTTLINCRTVAFTLVHTCPNTSLCYYYFTCVSVSGQALWKVLTPPNFGSLTEPVCLLRHLSLSMGKDGLLRRAIQSTSHSLCWLLWHSSQLSQVVWNHCIYLQMLNTFMALDSITMDCICRYIESANMLQHHKHLQRVPRQFNIIYIFN